jgi:cytochrome c peroxidase
LGDHIQGVDERGKFKVPTLRNISKTAPYMHNGYFKTLRGVIDFYNTRDIKPTCPDQFTTEARALALGCWPEPEVRLNVNHDELGKLGLNEQEVSDLESFLNTLTDSP